MMGRSRYCSRPIRWIRSLPPGGCRKMTSAGGRYDPTRSRISTAKTDSSTTSMRRTTGPAGLPAGNRASTTSRRTEVRMSVHTVPWTYR